MPSHLLHLPSASSSEFQAPLCSSCCNCGHSLQQPYSPTSVIHALFGEPISTDSAVAATMAARLSATTTMRHYSLLQLWLPSATTMRHPHPSSIRSESVPIKLPTTVATIMATVACNDDASPRSDLSARFRQQT
jgi:hypothetical protein